MRKGMSDIALPDPVEVIRSRQALVDVLNVIASGGRDAGPLESALARFRIAAGSFREHDVVWVFVELVEALAHAVRWTDAVWSAEQGADRHATAARLRAGRTSSSTNDRCPSALREAAAKLVALDNHDVPAQVAACLSAVPLPPRLTDLYRSSDGVRSFVRESAEASIPPAALLIRLQGEPVMRPTVVQPGALHQFEVEARVTEWPEQSTALEITFLSVHPRDFVYVSEVRFTKDQLRQPLEIRVAGARPPADPPLGLTAQAAFLVNGERRSAHLAGNTTLEIVTFRSRYRDTAQHAHSSAAATADDGRAKQRTTQARRERPQRCTPAT
jgi:hypothetical protein